MAAIAAFLIEYGPAITAAATVGSVIQSSRAASAQRRSLAAQQRMADLKNAREKREAYRKATAARAQVVAAGVSSGAGQDSSAIVGSTSGVQSQYNANLSFLDQLQATQQNVTAANQDVADYTGSANAFGAVASFTTSIGGPDMWKNVFKDSNAT